MLFGFGSPVSFGGMVCVVPECVPLTGVGSVTELPPPGAGVVDYVDIVGVLPGP